jgi:hypothetical protein
MNDSTWTWRIPSLIQAGVPLFQLAVSPWLVESPRWLVGKGRTAEARAIFVKFHGAGDENSPLVDHEMKQVQEYLLADAEVASLKWSKVRAARDLCLKFSYAACDRKLTAYTMHSSGRRVQTGPVCFWLLTWASSLRCAVTL